MKQTVDWCKSVHPGYPEANRELLRQWFEQRRLCECNVHYPKRKWYDDRKSK